jgi:hypothetical protein
VSIAQVRRPHLLWQIQQFVQQRVDATPLLVSQAGNGLSLGSHSAVTHYVEKPRNLWECTVRG